MAVLELIEAGGPQSEEDLAGEFRETIWRLCNEGLLEEGDDYDCLLQLTKDGMQYVREDIGDV